MAPNLDDLIEWLLDEIVSCGKDGQLALFSFLQPSEIWPVKKGSLYGYSPIKK
jgi:hypothetical protein